MKVEGLGVTCFHSLSEEDIQASTEDLAVTGVQGGYEGTEESMRAVGLAGWECDPRKAIFLTHSFLPCKMGKVKTCLLESQHWVAPSTARQGCLRRASLEACRMSR